MKKLDKILSDEFQRDAIKSMSLFYSDTISEYRDDVNEDYENTHLSANFQNFFKGAIYNNGLNEFNSTNWYWLKLIERIVHLIYLHENLVINDSDFELSESEDELFNFWHDSDYAKSFLEMINETKDLLATSKFHLNLLEGQVIAFFATQIDGSVKFDEVSFYNTPEIGDGSDRVFNAKTHSYFNLESKDPDRFIFTISNKDGSNLVINGERVNFSDNALQLSSGCFLHLSSSILDKDRENFFQRIEEALQIINNANPKLFTTFTNFTKAIVPINEKGIVSYSMQNLPGFSSINMYERDFLDLLDDLLHENGHHYMNAFLNVEELISDDDEKIYYSPWRRALRPVRGIYHAYFTFYWAFILYKSLYVANKSDSLAGFQPSKQQTIKILSRTLEEYHMINFCWPDLLSAHQAGKISDEGLEVISFINDELSTISEGLISDIEAELKHSSIMDYEKILELKKHLKDTREHYTES
mgnify:FL=1